MDRYDPREQDDRQAAEITLAEEYEAFLRDRAACREYEQWLDSISTRHDNDGEHDGTLRQQQR